MARIKRRFQLLKLNLASAFTRNPAPSSRDVVCPIISWISPFKQFFFSCVCGGVDVLSCVGQFSEYAEGEKSTFTVAYPRESPRIRPLASRCAPV